MELEKRIQDWEYWCPNCKNRTFGVVVETPKPLPLGKSGKNEKYLVVRVLSCMRCNYPTVIGTHKLEVPMGRQVPGVTQLYMLPRENLAFQLPGRERELPKGVSGEFTHAFREAERAVDSGMGIGAAAAIRTSIRIAIEDNGFDSSDLKSGINSLGLKEEFKRALGNLKLVGDHTLHYEKYEPSELVNALEVLYLAVGELYAARGRLADLEKAVGDKASKQGTAKAAKSVS